MQQQICPRCKFRLTSAKAICNTCGFSLQSVRRVADPSTASATASRPVQAVSNSKSMSGEARKQRSGNSGPSGFWRTFFGLEPLPAEKAE